ncbi:MAG: metallophosphoesterase family protein [Planctomycetes bacterium]|nr:metallophosphoesterase family protein [Planctomycetota bacterium]
MLIGILGDVHGNLEALDAVIASARRANVDHWVQVGDLVGYGADPGPCIDRIRELGATVCLGNHDAAVIGRISADYFNHFARAAIDWTRRQLRDEHLQFLASLQLTVEHEHYDLVHGSLHMPEQFGYVLSPVEAAESLAKQTRRIAFVGHSHVPALYVQHDLAAPHRLEVVYEGEFARDLGDGVRALLNVGSVGQPRDEDPRAAFALYDPASRRVEVRRVAYDCAQAQAKIRTAGLPAVLADRLSLGV